MALTASWQRGSALPIVEIGRPWSPRCARPRNAHKLPARENPKRIGECPRAARNRLPPHVDALVTRDAAERLEQLDSRRAKSSGVIAPASPASQWVKSAARRGRASARRSRIASTRAANVQSSLNGTRRGIRASTIPGSAPGSSSTAFVQRLDAIIAGGLRSVCFCFVFRASGIFLPSSDESSARLRIPHDRP